jgi:hypothetical protein
VVIASRLLAVVACASVCGAAPGLDARNRVLAPQPPWIGIRTPHFFVIGSVPTDDLLIVASRLERFHQTLSLLFPRLDLAAGASTTVVVFPSHDAYEPFKPTYRARRPVCVDILLPDRSPITSW